MNFSALGKLARGVIINHPFMCFSQVRSYEVLVIYKWVINVPRETKASLVATGLAPWSDKVCVLPFRYKPRGQLGSRAGEAG